MITIQNYPFSVWLNLFVIVFQGEFYKSLNNHISKAFDISAEYGAEDVSFYPPLISDGTDIIRDKCKRYLSRLIEWWIPKFTDKNITLSLEIHVTWKYFVFKGLRDYSQFVSNFEDLGVLSWCIA